LHTRFSRPIWVPITRGPGYFQVILEVDSIGTRARRIMHRTIFGRLSNCAPDRLGTLIHKPQTTRNQLLETKRKYHLTEPRERSGETPRELQCPLRAGDQQEASSDPASQFSSAFSDAVTVFGRARINPTVSFTRHHRLARRSIHHNPTTTKIRFGMNLRTQDHIQSLEGHPSAIIVPLLKNLGLLPILS